MIKKYIHIYKEYLDFRYRLRFWKCLFRWCSHDVGGEVARSIDTIRGSKLMLGRSIGTNRYGAGNIRVFDASSYPTHNFPVTSCSSRSLFSLPRYFHVWICAFFCSGACFVSYMPVHARLLFSMPRLDKSRPTVRCLRIKNQANLKQTVVLHTDENPRALCSSLSLFSTMAVTERHKGRSIMIICVMIPRMQSAQAVSHI